MGKTALGVELSLADGFRGCECHDAKSCRCIVALKEAASFKSFDIVVVPEYSSSVTVSVNLV